MEQNKLGQGFLSDLGLDFGQPQEVRAGLRNKRIEEAMVAGGKVATPYDVPVSRFGAMLGQQIAGRYGGTPDIDPEIESRLRTVQDSNVNMQRWQQLNPTATPDAVRKKYEEFVAESAFKNGLYDVGTQALAAIDERRKRERVQELQLSKLDREERLGKATEKSDLYKAMVDSKKAGLMEVYPLGSDDPNSGMVGVYDPSTESLRFADGRTAPITAFTFTRPEDPRRFDDRSGSGGLGSVPKNEAARLRMNVAAVRNVQNKYLSIMSLMKEAEKAGAQAYAGKAGQLTKFANTWTNFAQDMEQAVVAATGQPYKDTKFVTDGTSYDFRNPADRVAWAKRNREELNKLLPKGMGEEYSEAWIAAVTDLAYAKALTSEQGNTRSLSDADFKNAFAAVGGDLSSGKSLLKVFGRDAKGQYRQLVSTLEIYNPDDIDLIVSAKARQALERADQQISELTGEYEPEVFNPEDADDGIVIRVKTPPKK